MKRGFILLAVIISSVAFHSLSARKTTVLSYGTPESVGVNGEYLSHAIDSIANASIEAKCFPGCQILVARHGKIIHHKSYGYHTYEQERKVENSHLYDMASCTKVMAATMCLMHLVDNGKLDIDKPISYYLEEFKGSNKEYLTLREALSHQSGMRNPKLSKILFNENKELRSDIISTTQSEEFPHQFCNGLYVTKENRNILLNGIVNVKVGPKKFRYSCANLHLALYLVERITGRPYEDYLYNEIYKPLGVKDAMYNPKRKYALEQIAPTEIDNRYRKQLVHGTVHDEAAAFMGGVSGNAGLFANSESLAPILQMLLNGGEYNGVQLFKRKTIREWTSYQFPKNGNHRALGFDKRRLIEPPLEPGESYPYCYGPSASKQSFGHTGFTGTMVWVDPKADLIYVILSNRVHPSRKNKPFNEFNPRAQCHEAAYEAIRRYKRR